MNHASACRVLISMKQLPKAPANADKSNKTSALSSFWRHWLKPGLIIVVTVSTFRSAIADWNDVPTGSMRPVILDGDRVMVNKLAYALKVPFTTQTVMSWSQPKHGDVVTFWSPRQLDMRLIKRVVAVPGDTVQMSQGQLMLNGEAVRTEQPLMSNPGGPVVYNETLGQRTHDMQQSPATPRLRNFGPVTLGPGEYWMMGDNRDNSADSRVFGPVNEHLICGRAEFVVGSLNLQQHHLRWDRCFKAIE